MRKKIFRGLLVLTIITAAGTVASMTSTNLTACEDCKVKGKSPSERVCGSCKEKGMSKTKAEFKNGYWYVHYKCDHCDHETVIKTDDMKEI